MTGRLLAPLSCALLLVACASVHRQLDREGTLVDSPATNWREVATVDDRGRLRDWRSAFVGALKEARASGAAAQVNAEGQLLIPDAALPEPALPDGTYACRTVRLGAKTPTLPAYSISRAATCRVSHDGKLQLFAELTGQQRPVGLIFLGDRFRSVFLGTLILSDEHRAMQYGGDRDRDMAGYVERIAPRRWRLILPRPTFQSQFDVIDLVPTE